MMLKLGAETLRVGRTLGHNIPSPLKDFTLDDIELAAQQGSAAFEANFSGPPPQVSGYPSLYQDILKGRKTEIDYLNGYVAKRGKQIGMKTPYSEAAVAVIKGIEPGEFKVGIDNVERGNRMARARD